MKAIWNDVILAESTETINIEGNHYFPPHAIRKDYFHESDTHTVCPWKGTASYFNIVIDGKENKDAAWYYPDTKPGAKAIKDYIAFWRGVKVVE